MVWSFVCNTGVFCTSLEEIELNAEKQMHNKENKDKIVAQIVLSLYAAGQHKFCLRVWSYILLTVWLLPNNLLKAACGFGRVLVAVACAVQCQKFQVCCGVCESTYKHCHSTNPPPPILTRWSDQISLAFCKLWSPKPLYHVCFQPCQGPFDNGNPKYEKEQILPSLNVLSTPFFTTWNINVFLIFLLCFYFPYAKLRNRWNWQGAASLTAVQVTLYRGKRVCKKSVHQFIQVNFKTDFTVTY